MKELGVEVFSPSPFSPEPGVPGQTMNPQNNKPATKPVAKPAPKTQKPA